MKNRAVAAFLCACVAIALIIIFKNYQTPVYADDNMPTMFTNDVPWYKEQQYKAGYRWINIFLVEYIPIDMLEELEGVAISSNKSLRNVMINVGDKYMTFDTDTSVVYTDEGKQYNTATYLIYSKRYIPAALVCNYFGFSFEMNKAGTAVRIKDSSAKRSLEELLSTYNPALAEKAETSAPPETAPPPQTAAPVTETEEIGERTIYLVFTGCPNSYTSDILKILREYDCGALFLLAAEDIVSDIGGVKEIYAEKNSVGIYASDGFDAAAAEKTNFLLYRILKLKTRLVGPVSITNNNNGSLPEDGYNFIDFNADMPDLYRASPDYLTEKARRFIHDSETVVFRFHSTKYTVGALPPILEYIGSSPQFTIKTINETTVF